MRAPDGVSKAIDVLRLKTRTKGIELNRIYQPDVADHLAELCLGNQWILTRHRPHVDVKMTDLWSENWPSRTSAADAADLDLRYHGAAG